MRTAALLLAAALPAHAATDADLLRCRALADAGARLACYDALVATPAAAAPAPKVEFGFEARTWEQGPQAVESRIVGLFEGWEPNARIRLENGQVWQVIDGSRGAARLRDPKVKVTRGTFGTFFLEIEGKNQAPRVRRVE